MQVSAHQDILPGASAANAAHGTSTAPLTTLAIEYIAETWRSIETSRSPANQVCAVDSIARGVSGAVDVPWAALAALHQEGCLDGLVTAFIWHPCVQ